MTTIIGYVYNSDVSCPSCTLAGLEYGELRVPMYTDAEGNELESDYDANGMAFETYDLEGNRVGVVFAGTEWDYPLNCCECGEELDVSIICYCDTESVDCEAVDHYNIGE